MNFRPCIDIHNGKVKQIVGGSLNDEGDQAQENFVSDMEASDFAKLYRERGLPGGHVILLNAKDSEYYTEDVRQKPRWGHTLADFRPAAGLPVIMPASF